MAACLANPARSPATGSGVLDGETVAVKDLFASPGRGSAPATRRGSPAADRNDDGGRAGRLLDAGAAVAGIAQTEEFAYCLAGANAHYGTPPNPQAPGRISGGSTSGSASAVSLGQADIGLGTDTGGSVRVPPPTRGCGGSARPTARSPTAGCCRSRRRSTPSAG